jgi:hypothetical protein
MSRRTEHEEDVIINQEELIDETEPEPEEVDEETLDDWQFNNQNHLLNIYFSLKEYCASQGLPFKVQFSDLCDFLYEPQPAPDFADDVHVYNMYRSIEDYCDTHDLDISIDYHELCKFLYAHK